MTRLSNGTKIVDQFGNEDRPFRADPVDLWLHNQRVKQLEIMPTETREQKAARTRLLNKVILGAQRV